MNDEIQILLAKRVDLSRQAFHRELGILTGSAPKFGLAHELALLAPADALSALPHVAETAGAAAPDAIVSWSGDRASLLRMLAECRFGTLADLAASTLLGAQRYAILPGGGKCRIRRRSWAGLHHRTAFDGRSDTCRSRRRTAVAVGQTRPLSYFSTGHLGACMTIPPRLYSLIDVKS